MAKVPSDSPSVIALTEQWLVLYKPAGWLTIPASQEAKVGKKSSSASAPTRFWPTPVLGVLSEWAKERYQKVWVVHRLDQDTSGVVLFARSAADHKQANTWFEKRDIKKFYDCIASNLPSSPMMKIQSPVHGQKALTQVEVKESYKEGFLARVRPVSGRRHQIRIHLAERGNPIWGDRMYKGPIQIDFQKKIMSVKRVALHAAKLELPTGEVFECEWPEDFELWVEMLRKEGFKI